MHVFTAKKEILYFLENERINKRKIGFVPTMGALHEGHLELIKYALRENDVCVCSIFINPTQFNNPDDLEKYPVTIEQDLQVLKEQGCQVVFTPAASELYPDPWRLNTTIHFGEIESILEGKYRPGHFRGVGLVVTKLFNIVKPHSTYFGQKDLQQFHLVKQLIRDFSFDIRLICVPTVRAQDGLALSSRNIRIPAEDRPYANKFYECLLECKKRLKKGDKPVGIKLFATTFLAQFPVIKLEYIELIDTENFTILKKMNNKKEAALCIAGYINNIRLIDNVFIN